MGKGMFSLRYLLLRKETGRLLVWRDTPAIVFVAIIYYLIARFVPELNFFGSEGVIDRIGSLTSTLTGFYVAALVAAATFASSHAALDEEIKEGRVYQVIRVNGNDNSDYLTRREYVCAIFGYVSILALVLSIASILIVTIADAVHLPEVTSFWGVCGFRLLECMVGGVYSIAIGHLFVTTGHGLYYLSYRLYIGEGAPINTPWGDALQPGQMDNTHAIKNDSNQ